jgi:hypothetical protein
VYLVRVVPCPSYIQYSPFHRDGMFSVSASVLLLHISLQRCFYSQRLRLDPGQAVLKF